jgi:hypothetical protein
MVSPIAIWRDASPIERIDIQIKNEEAYAALLQKAGCDPREFLREHTKRVEELKMERQRLSRPSGSKHL